jgi:pimeloyl-[acyl-carrier protein] methyl ester esterase
MKVFLHGWGMRKEMFSSFIDAYFTDENVLCLSLPGYDGECDLDGFDEQVLLLSNQIPEGSHIIGWSLGGLFALRLAQLSPHKVSKVTMICSTPVFAQKRDWGFGLNTEILTDFGGELLVNREKTLRQFMLLQLHGQKEIKTLVKEMELKVIDTYRPSLFILKAGLVFLQKVDLREGLKSMRVPVSIILGGRDKIVSAEQALTLNDFGAHVSVHVIKRAGHIPFITHMEAIACLI